MKLPRDLSGVDLAKYLSRVGYVATRQRGSHIQLTSRMMGNEHHVSIPAHKTLKLGTLHKIMKLVSEYLRISQEDLLKKLFG